MLELSSPMVVIHASAAPEMMAGNIRGMVTLTKVRNGGTRWLRLDRMVIDDIHLTALTRKPLAAAMFGVQPSVVAFEAQGGAAGLIAASEEEGTLALRRIAVGDHILLGGDNMDLALAHYAAGKFAEKGVALGGDFVEPLLGQLRFLQPGVLHHRPEQRPDGTGELAVGHQVAR